MKIADLFEGYSHIASASSIPKPRPRVFYRGVNPGDTRRIKTGDDFWDSFLFVSSKIDGAKQYGSHIIKYVALPDAKIVYEGSAAYRSLAKGIKETNLLGFCSKIMRRAKDAGWDAVWFVRQADVGTVIINRDEFQQVEMD